MSNLQVKFDDKALKQLKAKLKSVQIVVGLPKGTRSHDESGESLIEIGATHEFGSRTKGIPERSFIRSTINESVEEYKKVSQTQAVHFLEGKQSLDATVEKIGIWGQSKIKKKFRNNNWAPNSRTTIALKGSSRPLIDTGQLLQSITWEVKK